MVLITASRALVLGQCRRAFSTSSARLSLQWDKNDPKALAEVFPPYPYGEPQWYKQQRLGLYGGSKIEFGNNKADKYTKKTRRVWRPNIVTRKLYSQALNRTVQLRVSTRVLRTIDKLGGLDEYLLGEKETRIKELGQSGWWLRWAIMQTPTIKARFASERETLGVPEAIEQNRLEAQEDVEALDDAEEVETLSTDDAFVVEQPAHLPPIKFRVGPRQHVILTVNGWKRVRPNGSHRERIRKEEIASTEFPGFVEQRVAAFEEQLAKRLAGFGINKAPSKYRIYREEREKRAPRMLRKLLREQGSQARKATRETAAASSPLDPERQKRTIDKARKLARLIEIHKNMIARSSEKPARLKVLKTKVIENARGTVKEARRLFRKDLEAHVNQFYDSEVSRRKDRIRTETLTRRKRTKVRRRREARRERLASPQKLTKMAAQAPGDSSESVTNKQAIAS